MRTRRGIALAAVLALAAGGVTAAATAGAAAGKPVIAKPVTVPAKPVAGKAFAVSFRVTRSDTGTRLLTGKMMCDPSIAGKVIGHAESFKGGTARLSFVVPKNAGAKLLKVRLTIKGAGGSATRIDSFRVKAAPVVPVISIAPAAVPEGNQATTILSLPVALSQATTQTVSVQYSTTDGTATAGSDYVAANGTLVFKPGETAKTVSITVNGDTAVESDETVTASLLNPVNATLKVASAVGTITNDDVAPRSGHYGGTTSQGRSIAFDVSSDVTNVTNFVVYTDVQCVEVPAALQNEPLDMTGVSFPIGPDWGFGFNDTVADSDGTATFAMHGTLSVGGGAAGTLRIDMAVNTDFGVVHCSTGNVTWNAS